MALPIFYPFKARHYQASSTTSNQTVQAVVVSRGKLLGGYLATSPLASHTAVGVVDVTVNGSTAAGMGAITITTSTGNTSTNLGSPTSVTFLSAGDVLATVASSVVGYSATFLVQEF